MNQSILKLSVISILLLLAACSSNKKEEDVSNLENTKKETANKDLGTKKSTVGSTDASSTGSTEGTQYGELDLSDPYGLGYSDEYLRSLGIDRNPVEYDTIYFPYNSQAISERGKIILEAHARRLQFYGATNVLLEGHADERGTREYNLALAERRGRSAQDLMNAVGTGVSTLQVVSYGEERPVILEQNESAWRANRRVQILY